MEEEKGLLAYFRRNPVASTAFAALAVVDHTAEEEGSASVCPMPGCTQGLLNERAQRRVFHTTLYWGQATYNCPSSLLLALRSEGGALSRPGLAWNGVARTWLGWVEGFFPL